MNALKRGILTQRPGAIGRRAFEALSTGRALAVILLALFGAAAFGLAPGTALETVQTVTVSRALALAPMTPMDLGGATGFWLEERIRRGDTIGRVLARLGVDDPGALVFLRTDPAARPLYQLLPGKALRVVTDGSGALLGLRFDAGTGRQLSVAREVDRLTATLGPADVETRQVLAAGEIRSSLFAAADAAGLPDAVTLQLADVFAGEIDFYKDLQRGDRFAVIYEMRMQDGEPAGPGRVVAAEFENRGKLSRAFLWRDADGSESFYSAEGAALRRAFLRSPMEFSRVTSGFSGARFHPILQTWRAHRGVDYAAPVGTPIRATGSGKVLFAGRQEGYGSVVQLQHQGVFSTLYAHLSRIAPPVRIGARVAQGEIIGYVGQTGWATGPHLHYEFRVAGLQRNPLTIALPGGDPLPPAQRAAFAARVEPAVAQLAIARQHSRALVAAAD